MQSAFIQVKGVESLVRSKEQVHQPIVVEITGAKPRAVVEIHVVENIEVARCRKLVDKADAGWSASSTSNRASLLLPLPLQAVRTAPLNSQQPINTQTMFMFRFLFITQDPIGLFVQHIIFISRNEKRLQLKQQRFCIILQ